MTNTEHDSIQNSNKFYGEEIAPSREDLQALAEAAEDGDNEAAESLRVHAENYSVSWEENYPKMVDEIWAAIENETEADGL